MLLFRLLPLAAMIVACTTQDVPMASRSAQFQQYPQLLFDTFEIGCSGPGESFEKISSGTFECSELLPPDTTAFLILNYDGYPQALPQSVMRLTSARNTSGYRVDAELYFRIPQRSGKAKKVPVESQMLDRELQSLYQALGGSPTEPETDIN